jgi:hypothetical protein
MLFLTRWLGVTGSDAERNRGGEQSVIEEIAERVLVMQANAASQQHRPLGRGTHVKGVCARARFEVFEVFDVSVGGERWLAERLAKGIFATPGVYPANVRFANADQNVNSDLKPDVRSLSCEATYFDVTGNSTPDSTPLGSINRARRAGEVASRRARMRTNSSCEP